MIISVIGANRLNSTLLKQESIHSLCLLYCETKKKDIEVNGEPYKRNQSTVQRRWENLLMYIRQAYDYVQSNEKSHTCILTTEHPLDIFYHSSYRQWNDIFKTA